MKRREKGFTLIEIMVVVVIIGILATLVIVNVAGKTGTAQVKTTQMMVKQVAGQVEMFKLNHNRYPETLEDLVRMPSYVDPKTWPPGGYLTEPAKDGWGRELVYRVPGTGGALFDVVSLGEDGREGGDGPSADIWNHSQGR